VTDRLIAFPAHALLILEERLREQEAEGVKIPEGMERDELALRILIAAELTRSHLRRGWANDERSGIYGRLGLDGPHV
jgi:hypothetical protein